MDRKTAVLIALILSVSIVLSVHLWTQHNRYFLTTSSSGAIAHILDKKTGDVWVIRGYKKTRAQ